MSTLCFKITSFILSTKTLQLVDIVGSVRSVLTECSKRHEKVMKGRAMEVQNGATRGVHLDHRVDFGLDVSGRFNIGSSVHSGFTKLQIYF